MTNQELSSQEKRAEIFADWLSPKDIEFVDEKAKEAYKKRAQRLIDVVNLKQPDKVPVIPNVGFFPAFYAEMTPEDIMYDYDKFEESYKKYTFDFEPDAYKGSIEAVPGKVFEALGYNLYQWPRNGTPAETSYQCVEDEYMKPEDYDALIDDPTDFWLRRYLPRICDELRPLQNLGALTSIIEMPFTPPALIPFGTPDVQSALKSLMEAGERALEWFEAANSINTQIISAGYPLFMGGGSKAPFDILADTLRGTQAAMLDMFRRPEKLQEAMERLTPLALKMGINSATVNNNPFVFMPLHKGADSFMSREQFKEFYWPTLNKVINGLIEEGLVPLLFAEGAYNERLDIIKEDIPKASTLWMFDKTDMRKANEILGDTACIAGNVPSSLMSTGDPKDVRSYCKELIEDVGENGGFILTTGAVTDEAKPENIEAMIEAGKEYGVY
ncbi:MULTISPECIES: uroporphyrinogen decarboxylase family protein [unclassified Candidatus Frackibacter]|uniref:uroporphyrinogen decarboxylase family protein n=1 Tax=unclassified Candidatus Frackibacter TaxID=2648818 RepID=UPI000883F740|nr:MULTISPECIES: uroporphyrinogen decarboxylase family protein [unclassified Candidatus Frackibacter]SDC26955.1 Uroporphyrinogen decarboxylase (URO-D) [Candidatus Frackibacter sp. WG11]SEM53960.1 Uroporphyrinogen decarboxylase (URO-D) [Candidatus Frackibacter sp. WG12]SFL54476.1 Uroporphyrinogen decarboxylase (URO-D) [Candidatus Frackibacter sp. WG13]